MKEIVYDVISILMVIDMQFIVQWGVLQIIEEKFIYKGG